MRHQKEVRTNSWHDMCAQNTYQPLDPHLSLLHA
jgi:hypothetical protein